MNKAEELENRKKQLIERYGVFFQNNEKLPPLAARIFAKLLIESEFGSTFDELVASLEASKSTISTNLNLLLSTNRINYITKPGDRRRHFMCSPRHFLSRIEKQQARYQLEYQLGEEIIDYKRSFNDNESDPQKRFYMNPEKPYLTFLKESMNLLDEMSEFLNTKFLFEAQRK